MNKLIYVLTRDVTLPEGTGGYIGGPGIEQAIYTAEDPTREPLTGRPEDPTLLEDWVAKWKVKGRTAIPCGVYRVAWTPSNRFKRSTLQLLGVPGYGGIRLHPGNDAGDTEGCILPGLHRVNGYEVTQSALALQLVEAPICRALERGIPVYFNICRG